MERLLGGAMDAAVLRQQVTADNIANVNTPRVSAPFRALRGRAVPGRTGPGRVGRGDPPSSHPRRAAPIGRVRPQVVRDNATVMRNDGNNVDIEREMAINAAAELQYAALTQVTSARYKMMRSAITQGGRDKSMLHIVRHQRFGHDGRAIAHGHHRQQLGQRQHDPRPRTAGLIGGRFRSSPPGRPACPAPARASTFTGMGVRVVGIAREPSRPGSSTIRNTPTPMRTATCTCPTSTSSGRWWTSFPPAAPMKPT